MNNNVTEYGHSRYLKTINPTTKCLMNKIFILI